MLIAATAALIALIVALIAVPAHSTNQRRTRHEASRERHRIQDRDWWVRRWLMGDRRFKRLTDQRERID